MQRCAWLFVLVFGLAVPAHAGVEGTGSSDTGPGDAGPGDAGSTTTGSDGTEATTADDGESTAACGGCEPDPGSIRFDSPQDGAEVDGPFVVEVTVTPACSCASCPCTEAPPEYTQLFLDSLAAGAPCYELTCSWELNPPVGDHALYVNAVFGVVEDEGTRIDIRVASMAASSDDGTPDPDPSGPSETSSTSAASTDDDPAAGCGCRASRDRGGEVPLLAALLLCIARGRRGPRRD